MSPVSEVELYFALFFLLIPLRELPKVIYISNDRGDDPRTDFFDMDFELNIPER